MRELTIPTRVREAAAGDGRTLEGVAVPWNTPTDATETGLAEQFARGAIDPQSVVGLPLRWRHSEPIGAITGARDTPDGLVVVARVADTTLGRDAIALLRELPDLGMSIRFVEDPGTDWNATPVTYESASVREISLTDQPAYPTARVQHVREREIMPDTATVPADQDTTTPADDGRTRDATPEVRDVTNTDLGGQLVRLREQVTALSAASSGRTDEAVSPLARFRSLGEWAIDCYRSTDDGAAGRARALAENVMSESPGLTTPTWLSDVKQLVDRGRPFLSTLGGGSALPAGEVPSWPYYDGTLSALVDAQSAELAEITSVQVEIKRGTSAIATYAGGSRSSFQLLERSSPAYYDTYLRILLMAYARRTEIAALAAAEAAAGDDIDDVFAVADPSTLFSAVIAASAALEDATGAGADVVVVAPSQWVGIAGALDGSKRPLFGASNPSNAPGVSTSPGVLSLNVGGVPLVRGAVETTAAAVVTNRAAFGWLEDGPRVITQDQVSILGKDIAVYGYAAPAAYVPAGIITITPDAG